MKYNSKNLQMTYVLCAIAGLAVTMYFNIQFMIEHGGFNPMIFLSENYVNHASASIFNDILVVTATLLVWMFVECKRLKMRYWWLYLILSLAVAIAFALPLFMLMRERHLAEQSLLPIE